MIRTKKIEWPISQLLYYGKKINYGSDNFYVVYVINRAHFVFHAGLTQIAAFVPGANRTKFRLDTILLFFAPLSLE